MNKQKKKLAPERFRNQPAYCRSLCSPLPKKLKIKDSHSPLLLEYLERKKQMVEKQGTNMHTKKKTNIHKKT